MKQINVYFEDKEFKALSRLKGKKSWRNFILQLLLPKEEGEDGE